ncbi:MAG TPA: transcription termination/antitermination NusG family protein [Pseudolabrys sp.]|nr:transcription termination/antitermination NusG family protein [Pseudolabrys sp.]
MTAPIKNNLQAALAAEAAEPLVPASFPVGSAWYVVYTGIKSEFRAKLALEAQGFAVYLPVEKKWVRHARRRTQVMRPLFSRYMFVRFDINRDHWYAIKRTDGVEAILTNDSIPVRVPAEAIEDLRQAQAIGVSDETTAVLRLQEGDPVRIASGPFKDFVARVKEAKSRKRVDILLQLFGSERILQFSLAQLRKV